MLWESTGVTPSGCGAQVRFSRHCRQPLQNAAGIHSLLGLALFAQGCQLLLELRKVANALINTCPYALVISTSVTIVSGLAATPRAKACSSKKACIWKRGSKLPRFVRLSRKTHTLLVQNMVLALGIKAVFLVLTMTGAGTMWMAVFADVGASLLVVANGLRLVRFRG